MYDNRAEDPDDLKKLRPGDYHPHPSSRHTEAQAISLQKTRSPTGNAKNDR